MTFSAIVHATLWALLLFTGICAAFGAIALFIGGFLVHVADREFRRKQRRKP